MPTFYILVTLTSLVAPQVLFMSPVMPWRNATACRQAIPRMEAAVQALVRYDPAALALFGEVIGKPTALGYFVSDAACRSADPSQ